MILWNKNKKAVVILGIEQKRGDKLIAYEFYLANAEDEFHLLGILPERRKDPLRITQESIMKRGKLVVGDGVEVKNIYFIQTEV